jgi:hypothetical protein
MLAARERRFVIHAGMQRAGESEAPVGWNLSATFWKCERGRFPTETLVSADSEFSAGVGVCQPIPWRAAWALSARGLAMDGACPGLQ